MAKYLSNIDLSNNELQNAVIHPLGTAPSGPSEGQVYYNTGQDKVYVYNGTSWISIAGDITEVQSATTGQLTVSNGTGPIPSLSIVTGAVTNGGSALATGDQIYDFVTGLNYTSNAGDITRVNITAGAGLTGTVDTASGDHTQTINVVGGDGITANADEIEVAVDNTTIELSASSGSGVVRAKTAAIVDGGTGLATADQIHTFVTGYADPSGTDNSTDVTLAGSLDYITISGQVITRNAIDLTTDVTGALPIANGGTGQTTAAAAANALLNTSQGGSLTIGDGSDEIVIPGDLTVTGTTTTNNVEVVSTSNGVIFEGNAADANELTLLAGTLTADRTVTLPDATGTVALTSDLHDAVTVTGSYDYITLSGQQITVGQVDYNTDIANTPTIPTVNNGTLTVQGTGALGGSGTFTANQSGNTTISISHDDTSTQASVNNSGLTVIQDVTLDTYGHTTGLASVDLTSGVDGRITAREFAVNLDAAEGSVTKSTNTYTVTHGLASRDVMIEIYDTSTYDTVYADVARPTTGTVTVAFAQSVTDGDYRVMIKKIG